MDAVGVDDRALVRAWREDADEDARAVLVQRMLPLARSLARRHAGKGEPLEDLEQVACVGLLKAIDRFDCERDVPLAAFAVPTIAGELKRHFRDRGWMLRVPRDVQELAARVSAAREALTGSLGRPPAVAELATAVGASLEQVVEALGAADAYRLQSLDEPAAAGASPLAALGAEDAGFELTEQRALLGLGLAGLTPREREIVRLSFYEGLSQREIAREVGLSQIHVSRLLRRAVDALRAALVPAAAAA
jgi:RNA polymerase sigma-B factor